MSTHTARKPGRRRSSRVSTGSPIQTSSTRWLATRRCYLGGSRAGRRRFRLDRAIAFTRTQQCRISVADCCLAQAAGGPGVCEGLQPIFTVRSEQAAGRLRRRPLLGLSERRSRSTLRRARSGCPLASTAEVPGGSSSVTLAMRTLVVALWSSTASSRLSFSSSSTAALRRLTVLMPALGEASASRRSAAVG